jgi:hypothetical protein
MYFYSKLPLNDLEGLRSMIIRSISILLTLFIFGGITEVWPNPIKSIKNTAHQITIMKMDENRIKEVSQGFHHG